jgi:hypothetical protein
MSTRMRRVTLEKVDWTNWFAGIQFKKTYNNLSFNAEVWWCLNEKIGLRMQYSDWEDGIYSPDQKTAFS